MKIYERISNDIKKYIIDEKVARGFKLPSINELCRKYECSKWSYSRGNWARKRNSQIKRYSKSIKITYKKIGCIDNQIRNNIEKLDSENLNLIIENILDIESIDDIKNILNYKR